MNENELLTPDYLFEVSWEVCNKVGGIHTVVSTKARTVESKLGDNYLLIGPDIQREGDNPEFEEDDELLKAWRQSVYNDGIRIRIGRWRVVGRPIAVLVDYTSLFPKKDDILKFLWETYHVDSISGQWDYIEPVLFGHAAGQVIASYVENFCASTDKVVAHFHEWMTAAGGLYLRKYSPYVATVFTTHATVTGRCVAGNGLPLYKDLGRLNAGELARQFNVVAKHSIEKIASQEHDVFCTVSEITARECESLLGSTVDVVTPNGFEDDFVWNGREFDEKRAEARRAMIRTAEATLSCKFDGEPLIVGTSGRYEFRNKGIDIFLDALKQLAETDALDREVLVYITVPSATTGPRKDLQAHLADENSPIDPKQNRFCTHYLEHPEWDQILNSIAGSVLANPSSKVKVVFVPTYLNGRDGIFDKSYYELLVGMDMTLFPSYYEPWGYTPLESTAFSVPTLTTTLAGFGLWAGSQGEHEGVTLVARNDDNYAEAAREIAKALLHFTKYTPQEVEIARNAAAELSRTALWSELYAAYEKAYSEAIERSVTRTNRAVLNDGGGTTEQINFVRQQLITEKPHWNRVMVEKVLPKRLHALEVLSHNLWWSWTSGARDLFEYIDQKLWSECEKNPIVFLDRLPLERLQELEQDGSFLAMLDGVYAMFNEYMSEKPDPKAPTIAYFSMEYGLHSSLKIYSGGLGILAGDYLKEASDKNVPMVAMGLLYRYGYFTQRLSAQGAQEATYEAQNFSKLPISPVRDELGNWTTVQIALPGRTLSARVWRCQVGRTDLFLLDTDYEANLDEDRQITHYLYGGDWENRLKQELLLGLGGIRALRAMGIKQEVYHCNEGHAAFIGIERIRDLVRRKLTFSEALEVVRSSSLFTTHTPVPAGHDAFPESMIRQYLAHYPDVLGITWEQFINLGKTNPNDPEERFSMSVLACNLSQEVNGVSWLHGEVSKDILGNMWPGYFKNELHIGYVTNGVHFPTWCASNLRRLYMRYFPEGFSGHDYDIPAWQKVHDIPAAELWQTVQRPRPGAHRLAAPDGADRRGDQTRRTDDRLRTPLRHLQARLPALHEPRPPVGDRQQQGAARAVHLRGQGAPQRQAGAGSHQTHRRGGGHAAIRRENSLPAKLRHGIGAKNGAGRRRVAQHADPPARSVGYVGREVRHERRAAILGARRLVGRGLQGGRRLGAADGTDLRRPAVPGRTGRGDDLQHDRGADRTALLQARRTEYPARLGRIRQTVRGRHRGELHDQPHDARLRGALLRQAGGTPARDRRGRLHAGARNRGMETPDLGRVGQGAHRRGQAGEDRPRSDVRRGALPLRDQDRRGRPPSRRHRRRAGRGQADRVRPAGQRDRNRTARTHGRRGDDRHLRARLPFGPLGVVRRGAAHLPLEPASAAPHGFRAGEVGVDAVAAARDFRTAPPASFPAPEGLRTANAKFRQPV